MSLSTSQLANYTKHIDKILAGADLNTVSVKKVRTTLQNIVGDELVVTPETKPLLNSLIKERFEIAAPKAGDESAGESAERPAKKRKASVKSEVEDGDEGVETKKVKREEEDGDADRKLAAMLQAEENKRPARAMRGAAAAKSAAKSKPAKKVKTVRKKREKVESEPEFDDEGNEIKKVKKGVFHREYLLSEPLGILVGGETQLSRPQTVKKIWEHIKANDLQVPTDKRQIVCDEKMKAVFKMDQVHMFTMNKILSNHFYPLEEDPNAPPKAKKVVKKEPKRGKGEKSNTKVEDKDEDSEGVDGEIDVGIEEDVQYGRETDGETPVDTPSTGEETPSPDVETPASASSPASEED